MAAIISVQTGTNRARPSPIVPVIPAIPRASAMVAAQAPAARISRNATSRVAARPGGEPGQSRPGRAAHPAQENGAEKPLCPSRPQSIPNVDRRAARAGATVRVVFDGWNTFVS